ncbi:MAG TPA: hypothetical protein VGQ77_02115 [Methylomirabilota bacterium]|nr:hypothetical protein [Methylomirabilota bacterium]
MRWLAVLLLGTALLTIATGVDAEVVAPGKAAPELAAGAWINSEPLTMRALRGRVVLVDFWTFG